MQRHRLAFSFVLAASCSLLLATVAMAGDGSTTRPAPRPTSPTSTTKPKETKDSRAEELKVIKSVTAGAPTPELLLKKSADAWARRDSKRLMAKSWGLVLEALYAREELIRAMDDRYGKDAPDPEEIIGHHKPRKSYGMMDSIAEHPDHINDMQVEVKDDRAYARWPDGRGQVEMVKQKDVWVLDDTKYVMAAKADEEGTTFMLIMCRGLLDTYRAGRPLVNEARTLDQFKSRFRSAAVRTMAPAIEELKQRREAERRKNDK